MSLSISRGELLYNAVGTEGDENAVLSELIVNAVEKAAELYSPRHKVNRRLYVSFSLHPGFGFMQRMR